MAVYAIGDVQGCFEELQALLSRINFKADRDQLWLTGDLVNRGPKSLETLRFVRALGDNAITVLGNHDLHLLAAAYTSRQQHKHDALDKTLAAPDREALFEWLRERPLLHHDQNLGFTLIHAGLPPQWDLATARTCAGQLETALRSDDFEKFLNNMYGDRPDRWSDTLTGWDRLRFITNCLTRLRYCDNDGRLGLQFKGPPGSQPAPFRPWFEIEHRASRDMHIVFGHWSTLGPCQHPGIYPLDTGCLWGGQLSALRLDGESLVTHIPCPGHHKPDGRKNTG